MAEKFIAVFVLVWFWVFDFVLFCFSWGFSHLLVSLQNNGLHNLFSTNINRTSVCSTENRHQHGLLWQPCSTQLPEATQVMCNFMAPQGTTCPCPWSQLLQETMLMSVISDAFRGLADGRDPYWDPVGCYRSVHPQKATWILTVTPARKHLSQWYRWLHAHGRDFEGFCSNPLSSTKKKQTV